MAGTQRRINELNDEQAALKAAVAARPAAPATDPVALTAAQAAAAAARQLAEAHAQTIGRLTAERASLAHDLDQSTARAADLARQLAATEQALAKAQTPPPPNAAPSLQPALDATKAELATTLADYSRLQRENEQLKTGADEVTRLAAEKAGLAQQLAASEQAARALDGERAALRQQLADLASRPSPAEPAAPTLDPARLADVETKLATALRSFSLLQTENDRHQTEVERLTARNATLESELAGNRTTAGTQVAALQDQLATATATVTQAGILHDQLRQTQDQVNALTAENAQMRTRLAITTASPGTVLGVPTRPGTPAAASAALPPAPAPAAPEPRTHTVVSGDTLSRIARQYYGDSRRWPEILEANRFQLTDDRSLRLGMKLRLP